MRPPRSVPQMKNVADSLFALCYSRPSRLDSMTAPSGPSDSSSSSPSPVDLSRAHLAKCLTASPIYGFLMSSATIHSSTSHGKSIATLTLTSAHVNSKGSLHGSVSATMVDWSSGNALATMGSHSGVSVDMHVSFLSGKAKVGDTIRIEGTIDRLGRTLAFTSVRITKEESGEVVILASHTKHVG